MYKATTSSEGELIVENLFSDSMGKYMASVLMNTASNKGKKIKKDNIFTIDYHDSVKQVKAKSAGQRIKSVVSFNSSSLTPQPQIDKTDWRKGLSQLNGVVEATQVVNIKKHISFRLFQKALKSIPPLDSEPFYNHSLYIKDIPDIGMAYVLNMGNLTTLQRKIYNTPIKLTSIESIGSHQNEYYVACIKR